MTTSTIAPTTDPTTSPAGGGAAPTSPAVTPARPASPPTFAATVAAYAGRTVRQYVRTPQLLVVNAASSIMFLLAFRYVFGGAIDSGALAYEQLLITGLCAVAGLFAGGVVGVAEDAESGFFDRLRSLPVRRSAILVGRSVADTALICWNVTVTVVVGVAVGFRPEGSGGGVALALGLCVVFAAAFSWLHIYLGLVAGTAQSAQGMAFSVFPLIFVSSAYVPVESMPGWLRPIAEHQPVTAMVDAVRATALGGDVQGAFGATTTELVVRALLWSAALAVLFAVLSARRFARR